MSTPAHIFKCKHCHTPLGVTLGAHLMVGAVKFEKGLALRCAVCNRQTYWAPDRNTGQLVEMMPAKAS